MLGRIPCSRKPLNQFGRGAGEGHKWNGWKSILSIKWQGASIISSFKCWDPTLQINWEWDWERKRKRIREGAWKQKGQFELFIEEKELHWDEWGEDDEVAKWLILRPQLETISKSYKPRYQKTRGCIKSISSDSWTIFSCASSVRFLRGK